MISPVFHRPWLMVWPGFELTTSRSTDRRSCNWANRTALKMLFRTCLHGGGGYNLSFNLITLYMIGGVTRHMLPHLSTGHGVFHLQVNRPLGYPEYSWISSGAINLYLFGQGNLRLDEITRATVLFSRTFYILLNVFKSEHFSVFLSHHIFESENFRISFF